MVGLGIMIYLIARATPRIGDDVTYDIKSQLNKLDKIFSHARFEKFDAIFNNIVEKGLRKLKLILMKLDNLTNDGLDRIKSYKNNGNKNGVEKSSLFERQLGENIEEVSVPEKTDDNNM